MKALPTKKFARKRTPEPETKNGSRVAVPVLLKNLGSDTFSASPGMHAKCHSSNRSHYYLHGSPNAGHTPPYSSRTKHPNSIIAGFGNRFTNPESSIQARERLVCLLRCGSGAQQAGLAQPESDG